MGLKTEFLAEASQTGTVTERSRVTLHLSRYKYPDCFWNRSKFRAHIDCAADALMMIMMMRMTTKTTTAASTIISMNELSEMYYDSILLLTKLAYCK
jgi:hypothetical protein